MDGFGLLVGHLVGDYIIQNDWMAKNKVAPLPGPQPTLFPEGCDDDTHRKWIEDCLSYVEKERASLYGHLACTLHCLLYTLSIWVFSSFLMPWWALLLCFLIHWPIDRFRLARKWMERFGQKDFATGIFSPWSIIVVDNTLHLVTLFVLKVLVEVYGV